jgi:HlyD family secretion protein
MKKIIKSILLVVFIGLLIWPLYYFTSKKNASEPTFSIVKPERKDLKNFIICSGIVLPKEEAEIKSRVSGVLEALYVKNGDSVQKNQVIAKIKIIPNMVELASAESQLKIAKINFENQEVSYKRNKLLYEKGVISRMDFEAFENTFLNAKEQLKDAQNRYRIVKSGNYATSQNSNTSIISTIDGIVTDLPTKIGVTVIQSNNFNDGTTIAKIANIETMVFEGSVKEYEVSKLAEGMNVIINSAIDDQNQQGILSEVATSGKNSDGMILFDIKSTLVNLKTNRSGFSANAKIITKERNDVLSVKEEWITIEQDSAYVFIHTNDDAFEKRFVELGLSDGIYTEVLSGLQANEEIRVYDQ